MDGRRTGALPAYAPAPLPELRFPEELPVSRQRETIAAAIREHPVVIVCGETGSGKTTQLPKICLLAGRGSAGLIGHTQPRRLAATSVAKRIAQELGSPPGTHVGYKIRFAETIEAGASIKLMTDGILLAETLSDPLLERYDTLIIDEAHERSLNIDFLLGYVRRLLEGPRRDTLRVVITSATIDAERFARHFGSAGRAAPVIEVSGRLYPVEVRYRPALPGVSGGEQPAPPAGARRARGDDDETDLPARIEDAIDELWREAPGDVLVFLPGEREIRDAAQHLRRAYGAEAGRRAGGWSRGPVEILPLFARLPAAEQQRIFSSSNGRRIVLATNVAETSLTVPGIRYVVDTGLARVKRYRLRGKVEQLQIEPISQAAANQRSGRCGRVMGGVCIRLYDEGDFARRTRFTDPEIMRSSLAGVILRMRALRLGEIDLFPFLDPPSGRAIADGFALLRELHALDDDNCLTDTGRQLARLPLDPRVARMLLAGHETGALREVLIVAAALSVQDPRERPIERQQAADQAHRRFADEKSDFSALVRIWDYWQQAQKEKESNRLLAARLEREFLSVRRLREWSDVHGQLAEAVRELRWRAHDTPCGHEPLHRALLTGLLGNLGCKAPEEPTYAGTHQTRFAIHPSSGLVRKAPRWLMAAEMVDTNRLYARTVARIEPEWIEAAAEHLIQRSWSEPRWSKDAGQVVASERGMLYGLVVYAQRRVDYAAREPVRAREVLIREALVGGDWMTGADEQRLPFLRHNRRLVAEIEKLEHKIRRPELLVDENFLYDWFAARIPSEIVSGRMLEDWYRKEARQNPRLLMLAREELLRKDSEGVSSEAFPRRLRMRAAEFELDYHFDPGSDDDGVTLVVPLALLNQVDQQRCEWLVAGMLRDKAAALLRSLAPKLRRHVAPIPEYAQEFAGLWQERSGEQPLLDALIADLQERRAIRAAATDFRLETVPAHLQMNYRVVDAHGRHIAQSRNLARLRADHGDRARGAFQQALAGVAGELQPGGAAAGATEPVRSGAKSRVGTTPATTPPAAMPRAAGERHTTWSFGELPELLEMPLPGGRSGATLIGYPGLVDRGDAVELQVFDDPDEAAASHHVGVRRLLAIALREQLRFFERGIPGFQQLAVAYASFGDATELRAELVAGLIERACLTEGLPGTAEEFAERVAKARPRLNLVGQELVRQLAAILAERAVVIRKLATVRAFPAVVADVEEQLASLLPRNFVTRTPLAQWPHLPRFLKAIAVRLDKLREDPERDAQRRSELAPLIANYRRVVQARRGQADARVVEFGWLLEELRVSLFAQTLRTAMPVSVKRLHKALQALAL